jgi:hypothetical protein
VEAKKPDAELIARYVELQAQTACRKCKKKDWILDEGFGTARGGERVGIFVVLSKGAFVCKGCGHRFERPFYSREQLAAQEFPAVVLDVSAGDEKKKRDPGSNGH